MKPTNFSKYLTDFLLRYLPHEEEQVLLRSIHTGTFTLYLVYMESKGVKAEKTDNGKYNKREYLVLP